jgi:lysyl-tRNA synthetase class 1
LLIALVKSTDLDSIDPKELNQAIYDRVVHAAAVDPKAFFTVVYQTLIGRDQGPRLPGFLKEIGQNRLLELLSLT